MKEKEEIEPFSAWIMHGRLRLRLMGHKIHVMTTALEEGEEPPCMDHKSRMFILTQGRAAAVLQWLSRTLSEK